jgi:AcrR family transcriptional regulator
MVEQEPGGTKLALILAGGELFAESGLGGTSIRAIAERAGANIAAINYHFGSKENLYGEVLSYAVLKLQGNRVRPSAIVLNDDRLETQEGLAEVIFEIIRDEYQMLFAPDQPRWYGRVVMRSLLDPGLPLQEVVRDVLKPDHEALKEIARRAKPDMSEEETIFWALSIVGQVLFYEFARTPLLMMFEKKDYDPEFMARAREHIARMIVVAMGLPMPREKARVALAWEAVAG